MSGSELRYWRTVSGETFCRVESKQTVTVLAEELADEITDRNDQKSNILGGSVIRGKVILHGESMCACDRPLLLLFLIQVHVVRVRHQLIESLQVRAVGLPDCTPFTTASANPAGIAMPRSGM